MGKLTSIYNFVPLNEQVFYPSWADEVSQDAPFSDGEDGYIEVTLRNVSPLFIRNGNADRNSHDPHSAHVMIDGKRLYFLPATSIKGMLRSTLEIMSFGKMTQYTNRFFSKRELGGKLTPDGDDYVELMKGVKPAWLRMEGKKLYLTPCDGDYLRINYDDISKKYPGFNSKKTGYAKNEAIAEIANEWFPHYELDGSEYRLVCTGNIDKKKQDYLFPIDRLDEFEVVGENVKKAFFTVHEPSPNFDKISDFLKQGKELAVFYLPGKDPFDVKAIGISAMLRYPYKQSIDDLVKKQQTELDLDKHDLVETIFGYTAAGNADCLRGRVQVGNAFAEKPLPDCELPKEVTGVQGQPKPSFYPFYVKQTTNPYKTYDNADGIAGRKLYRVHRGSTITALPVGNDNKNAQSCFIPIPVEQTFHLRIAVHNLRKMETGAILSALTLHKTKGAWHNIGLARGYGYGKLEIGNIKLSDGFSLSIDDYLKEFERQMSVFTHTELPTKAMWANTPQVSTLVSIHGEHDDANMRVMEINSKVYGKEYIEAKRLFDKLTEKAVPVTSFLSEADKEEIKVVSAEYQKELASQKLKERKRQWSAAHKADYDEANALFSEGEFYEAISKLNAMIEELRILGLDTTDEDALIENVRNCKKAELEKRQKEAFDKKEKDRLKKLSAGLGATLDEVFAEGTPYAGQYKVTDFKGLNNRTDQWIKKLKKTDLTDAEKEAYASTFRRIYQSVNHTNKKNKELAKVWQTAQKILGNRFDTLLGKLYKQ